MKGVFKMKTITIKKCLVKPLLFTFILIGMLEAQIYYVDKNHASASDSNPGTESQPWATIQHAAETLTAGETVYIRAGVYYESIYIDNSGNATDGSIVFSGYPGEKPVIDGTGVTDTENGVIIDKSYIKFKDIEIRNWSENAMWIENAGHIEISDCEVHDVYYGIGLSAGTHDFELNRVVAHHFSLYGFDASPDGTDCYNGTFNDCVAHTGRDSEANVDGFALGHGTQHDFVFNRCTTYNVYDGFDISSRNSTLNNCLAYDCWNGAYKLWADQVTLINCIGYNCSESVLELDWDEDPGTTTLMNCTFYNGQTYTIRVESELDGLNMSNCILAGGDNIGLLFEETGIGNYHGDYNIFHNNNSERAIVVGYEDEFTMTQIQSGAWTTYSGEDAHSLVASSDASLFVNPGQPNLHLLSGSLGVDHGTGTGAPSQDYEGNPRPSGSGYDIGAYEYQVGTNVKLTNYSATIPLTPILCQNYPNPFNPATAIDFVLPEKQHVVLNIYNLAGQKVEVLGDKEMGIGEHQVNWNASNYVSGLYFLELIAGGKRFVKKMHLIK